jgi:peroxiredoxin
MSEKGDSKPGFLEPGIVAPDFELKSSPREMIKLRDLRGKPVILAFYPNDFSPVCGDQMALYNDSAWCHGAYAKEKNLHFRLLADFEPKGEVARKYGAYRAQDGTEERALFVIDRDGVIHWSYLSPIDTNPGADGILDALDSLREKEQREADVSTANASRPDNTSEARP